MRGEGHRRGLGRFSWAYLLGPSKTARKADTEDKARMTYFGTSMSVAVMTAIAATMPPAIVEAGACQMFLNRFFIIFSWFGFCGGK